MGYIQGILESFSNRFGFDVSYVVESWKNAKENHKLG
jgi:hypothetical protein